MKRFQQLQQQLAAHIRDPQRNAAPKGVDDARLRVYRRLFFNNILGFTTNAFPTLAKLLGDDKWEQMNRAFYSKYQCHSPYFIEISKQFLEFLSDYGAQDIDTLLLYELAHFEWTQFELNAGNETAVADSDADDDLFMASPVLSSLARLLSYQWPVHTATADSLPSEPKATHLLSWRDADQRVRFMECNAVSVALIKSLQANLSATGEEHIRSVIAQAGIDAESGLAGGKAMLLDLKQRGAILGARKPADARS